MDLMGKKAIWDRIWRLPSGRRPLYLIEAVFGVDLYEKAIGDRVGKLSGAAELVTTDLAASGSQN